MLVYTEVYITYTKGSLDHHNRNIYGDVIFTENAVRCV